jgi:hypothetical protein
MHQPPGADDKTGRIEQFVENHPILARVAQWVLAAGGAIGEFGSAVTDLFVARWGKLSGDRVADTLSRIQLQLDELAVGESMLADLTDEEFADFLRATLEDAARTPSSAKRQRLADITVNQLTRNAEWDDAIVAERLAARLDDLHVAILRAAVTLSPQTTGIFEGVRVFLVKSGVANVDVVESPSHRAEDMFPAVPLRAARIACAELVAAGLLYDVGAGRHMSGAMLYFTPTDSGEWFVSWLRP